MAVLTLVRIIGNEIPGRDLPGGRLRALEWTLANEPALPGCRPVWLLNRIALPAQLAALRAALAGREVLERPFCVDELRQQPTEFDARYYLTDINGARNDAIAAARTPYVAAFDSEVFFSLAGYEALLCGIVAGLWRRPSPPYYAVQMYRLGAPEDAAAALEAAQPFGLQYEVQLIVRAGLRPYGRVPYGLRSKVELLVRLGYPASERGQAGWLENASLLTAGWTYHYPSGERAVELREGSRGGGRTWEVRELLRQVAAHWGIRPHAST